MKRTALCKCVRSVKPARSHLPGHDPQRLLHQRLIAPLACPLAKVGQERSRRQRFLSELASAAVAENLQDERERRNADERVCGIQVDQSQASATVGLVLDFVQPESQQAPFERETRHVRRGADNTRRQELFFDLEA